MTSRATKELIRSLHDLQTKFASKQQQFEDPDFSIYLRSHGLMWTSRLHGVLDTSITTLQSRRRVGAIKRFRDAYNVVVCSELIPILASSLSEDDAPRLQDLFNKLMADPNLNVADPLWVALLAAYSTLVSQEAAPELLSDCRTELLGFRRWHPDTSTLAGRAQRGYEHLTASAPSMPLESGIEFNCSFNLLICSDAFETLAFELEPSGNIVPLLKEARSLLVDNSLSFQVLSTKIRDTLSQVKMVPVLPAVEREMIPTRGQIDIDLGIMGFSNEDFDWSNLPLVVSDMATFSLTFVSDSYGGKDWNGNLVTQRDDGEEETEPLSSCPQSLICQLNAGHMRFDVIVMGSNDSEIPNPNPKSFRDHVFSEFLRAMEIMLLDENYLSRIKFPGLISHCRSNLTHKKGLHYAITETSDAQILFEVFQKLLDPECHVMLVALGCKARGCSQVIDISPCLTAPSHLYDPNPHKNSLQKQPGYWSAQYNALLRRYLNLEFVQQNSTFFIADFGIEYANYSTPRFFTWSPEGCKSFREAMSGGDEYFSFGLRQLAAFGHRSLVLERYVIVFIYFLTLLQ